MAGIGFELRRAVRDKHAVRRAGGYFSAAFTCFGGMLIGIILLMLLQFAAGRSALGRTAADLFMGYVTNTMFLSMLCCSVLSLVLSRFVSDMLFEQRYEAVMPSLAGGTMLTLGVGGTFFALFLALSGTPAGTAGLLMLLFACLTLCWNLMNYISLLRDYRQIVFAFLSALGVCAAATGVLALCGLVTLHSMILVLILAYAIVDAWLFRAVYLGFPVSGGGVLDFLPWLKRGAPLVLSGLMLEIGLLGHFWITWYLSPEGTRLQGLFACSLTYDFPAIVAYFSTIPAMVYFITLFETDFDRRYHAYLDALARGGRNQQVRAAHEAMLACVRRGLRNFSAVQIISCLLFITIGAKVLSVMNIGMTERMLETFRMFCVGYALYAIGNVIMLLQMYFVNEKRTAAAASVLAAAALALTWADTALNGRGTGLGFSLAALLFVGVSVFQLASCLDSLEYHILCQGSTQAAPQWIPRPERFAGRLRAMPAVRRRLLGYGAAAVCAVLVLVSGGSMAQSALRASRLLTFAPAYSEKALRSPGIGYAPWANTDEAEAMETALVYVELRWADWEPTEGTYDVDFVTEEYRLDTYREQGRQVVFRFICDEPTDADHIDIPDWLYADTGDGQHYSTSYGMGYSPNYANDRLLTAHTRAVAALGEAFGGDDFFHYVQLGSLGHWGEYHVNIAEGLPPLPYYDTRIEYIKPYLTAFPNAHFMTRYPLLETVKFGFGLYNDMTGDPTETEYWLEQMAGGVWEQTGLPEQADCRDMWLTHPVGGEFASSYSDSYYLHDNLSVTLEMLRQSHQSFIGPKIIVNETEVDFSSASQAILTTIGYRYWVPRAVIDLSPEDCVLVDVTLSNRGNAPIYDAYTVRLALYDDAETELWSDDLTDLDLRLLLPGTDTAIHAAIPRDGLDDDAVYTLVMSIVNEQGVPAVPMAVAAEHANMEYTLADFMIGR